MDDFVIPQNIMVLLFIVVVPWLVHITRLSYKNKEDIAINTANDANVNREFKDIKDSIEKMSNESRASFDKLEKRFDLFIGQEMSFLKGKL